tara:strand:- start:274 stop:495 length:222 start_codon:yes stop_codon:yes gene_type:complete
MTKSMTKTDMSKVNGGTPHYTGWGGKKTSLRGSFRNSNSTILVANNRGDIMDHNGKGIILINNRPDQLPWHRG